MEETALVHNLEIVRGARQRYLVQRWGEGTVCDKTGRNREIEVQFHCSTTTTDTIMFIKETSTCKYSLVIHTPRLCGEPGFKSRAEQTEAAPIRCRQIVADPSQVADGSLHESPRPGPHLRQRFITGSTPDPQLTKSKEKKADVLKDHESFLNKLLDSLKMKAKDLEISLVSVEDGEDGEQYWVLEGDEALISQLSGDAVGQDDTVQDKNSKSSKRSSEHDYHEEL